MQVSLYLVVMLIVLAGSCIQSALGFGTTMITMGFLPLLMDYSKAMGLSIIMVSISTVYISFKYRDQIRWNIMLPFLIPTAVICGIVNILSARVDSDFMYLLLGIMFVAVSIFFFFFSGRVRIQPTVASGTFLGIICGSRHSSVSIIFLYWSSVWSSDACRSRTCLSSAPAQSD